MLKYFPRDRESTLPHQIITETRCQFHQRFMRCFYARRSQKRKKQLSHQYLFTLSGSAHVKAVCRTLIKLKPVVTTLESNANCY